MNPILQLSWQRAWVGLRAAVEGNALRDALLARYSEPHRKYHTLQHLEECVRLFERVRELADRPDEVEMALWFHDAVYDLKAADNEERSAAWAREALLQAGVPVEVTERVRQLVLVTKHTQSPCIRDEQVLVDIDLSILGASAQRFAEYERQIRTEYAHVPGFLFRMKRLSILKSFLKRAVIYSTPELRQELEQQARVNLSRAVAGDVS